MKLSICRTVCLVLSRAGHYIRVPKRHIQVHAFCRHLYYSVAETLPHTLAVLDDNCSNSSTDTPDGTTARERLIDDILDVACAGPLDQESREGPAGLAKRYLPPGRLSDLFLLYVASCQASKQTPASAETFRRVWRSGWSDALGFRKSSTHALCHRCHTLRTEIKHAVTLQEHVAASEFLMRHLQDQWLDRKCYWSLRTRARTQKDLLCVITDGMDKSKFCLPRWAFGRCPKHATVEKLHRPTLHVSAVLCHGFGTYVFITDEGMPTGANYSADIVLRSLDMVWHHCQRCGLAYPGELSVHADNTVAEVKNSIFGRCLATLVATGHFRAAGHQHLRVGHSHEDVGPRANFVTMCSIAMIARDAV